MINSVGKTFEEFKSYLKNNHTKFTWRKGWETKWRRKILTYFSDLGNKKYEICVPPGKIEGKLSKRISKEKGYRVAGEHIFDLCWYSQKPDEQGIELAVEVEWVLYKRNPYQPSKGKDVDWDFYKLIDAKAYSKVLVSYVPPKLQVGKKSFKVDDVLDDLQCLIEKAKIKVRGEKYLLVLFSHSEKNTHPVISARIVNYMGVKEDEWSIKKDDEK